MKNMKQSGLAALTGISMLLTACGTEATATPAPAAAPTNTAAAAAAPTNTAAMVAAPTNTTAAMAATDTPAAAKATDTPAAAAATTPTEAPTPAPVVLGDANAKVTITIWHGWQGEYFNAIQQIFSDYRKDHPDVAINLQNVPDLDTKVKNAVPAGAGPDIIAWVDDHIGGNALADVIVPLDGKGGIDQAYLAKNYPKVAVDAVTYNGQIYGLPESLESVTMIYNKALIKESDLPKNTTELLEKAKAYNAANPGKYYAVWNPKDAYFNAFLFYGAGASYVNEKGEVNLDNPQGQAAAQFIHDAAGILPKDVDYNAADSLFKAGNAPIIINGPWYIADLEKAKIDFGLAKLPMIDFGNKGVAKPFVGVKVMMLAKGSKNEAAAVDLMKYYNSQVALEKLSKAVQVVPAQLDAAKTMASNPVVAGFNAQATDGVPLPNTPFMGALWDPVAKGLEAIFTGKDPKATLTDVQNTALSNIAKMN
jgi:arabinogalactan oligomer/maltooligosaccharide transport system substrate-binding protein